MNKLLNRIPSKSNDEDKIKDQIAYVCDMHFPTGAKYRKDAELIFETAIMAFEPFERSLILSAIASADENKDAEHQNASKSVGAGLRMFFENMGPAWVKFGQLLSYVPELPSEIRDDLGKLKDKADIPPRWELFDSIKNTLPNELQKNIVSVDEILGAGSFWITAKIKYLDKNTGNVQNKVLSLLRPYALERSRAGFKIIEKAVGELSKKDKKYKSLLKVAQQAKASAEYEVDADHGNKQFEKAKHLYGDISVDINGEKFTPNVANWEYYGIGKDKIGYKIMELAQGSTLDSANFQLEEKRKMALAYVATELTILFKGDVWDIDRHMGQQNFNKKSDGNYDINIYDTGAQINNAPSKTDKILLAEVLYGLIRAARTGIPLDQQILKTIKNMDKLETYLKVDTNYVADVQKGLLALSDIIEYQKEIKDKDGNIIQERLSLSEEDLTNVIEAVYENPSAEKTIKTSLAGKVMLNKLRPLRKGWISSLMEGISKKSENPIKIELKLFMAKTNSIKFDKPESEILDMQKIKDSEQILGMNKKYIKKTNAEIPMDILSKIKLREIA
jgi:frataxin-like iron-binding protein CyaY